MASSFKKALGYLLPIAGAATGNPLLAAAGGAAGGAMNNGTKGALMGGATAGGLSFLGNKFMGGGGGGSKTSNPFKSLTGIFGGGGGSNSITTTGNSPSTLMSGVRQQSTQGSKFGLGSLTKNPLLLGLGTMAGSQFIQSPDVPELPQSVIDFQNQARTGNPLQNKAQEALMQQLSMTQQNLGQPEIDAINREYDIAQEQELKSVDSLYKSLRPGSDPLTDTAYQKDLGRVRDRYATLRADSVAGAQRQISNDFASQRANTIAQSAGLSQQQMEQLSQLSQYDLDRQLQQLQIDYTDKQFLRDYLLQFGGNIVASQFPQQNPLAQLFGLGE